MPTPSYAGTLPKALKNQEKRLREGNEEDLLRQRREKLATTSEAPQKGPGATDTRAAVADVRAETRIYEISPGHTRNPRESTRPENGPVADRDVDRKK